MKHTFKCFLIVVVILCSSSCSESRFIHKIPSIKTQAKPIIESLDARKDVEGIYPDYMPDDDREVMEKLGFRIRYYTKDNGNAFVLEIGDYLKDGGILIWDSRKGKWHEDS